MNKKESIINQIKNINNGLQDATEALDRIIDMLSPERIKKEIKPAEEYVRKQIPEKAGPVKCGFCGKTMSADEWRGHQYSHGGAKTWCHTPQQLVRRKNG